ncbi:hypothetical protein CWI71_08565 [Pseudidiomarina insulisalsae]|uniref:Uncharacterized protein n=2 Tax=Pseudidiomarina insulisalsae TaxID=575789 RepID=A0A432YEU7_9GAMM|nr:hypothetical protein CWI71_08565 [Pseudidiomarina insulisalsae]
MLITPFLFLLLSGVITALIAQFRKLGAFKWFFVGLLLPFASILIALFWPAPRSENFGGH